MLKIILRHLTSFICAVASALAAEKITKEQGDLMEIQVTSEAHKQERVLSAIALPNEALHEVLREFSLTKIGDVVTPKEGRIATNLIVDTKEQGKVMVRLYPAETPNKLETGELSFEIDVLSYLNKMHIRAPHPIATQSGQYILDYKHMRLFIYPLLNGDAASKEDLSEDLAAHSGTFLSKMTPIACAFKPSTVNPPQGDFDYLERIYLRVCQSIPQVIEEVTYGEMLAFIKDAALRRTLERTPLGFVHADFFFENFLLDGEEVSLIDFGDAYYGYPIMDVAIGAMEFSAVSEDKWNFVFFKKFVLPNAQWLHENDISANFFINLMRANCFRFAIYTARFTLEESQPLCENPYVQRFKYLGRQETQQIISSIFKEIGLKYE